MPALSGLDSAAIQVLRAKLEAIPEVEAVLIDEPSGVIHLVCEPQAAAPPILRAAAEGMKLPSLKVNDRGLVDAARLAVNDGCAPNTPSTFYV